MDSRNDRSSLAPPVPPKRRGCSSHQSIVLFSGYPPQNRNVLKRQAPPSGTNTTLATSDTASASQLVPHDPPPFSHSTISSCPHDVLGNMARAYALRPCQKMWSGFLPRLKLVLKMPMFHVLLHFIFVVIVRFLGFEVKIRTLSFSFHKDSYLLVRCWQEQNVTA
jgi:hypothetical protein